MAVGDVAYTDLSVVEENGTIQSMTAKRIYVVTGATASAKLASALSQCGDVSGDIPAAFTNLRLTKRTAKLIDETLDLVEVTIEYGPAADYLSTTFMWESDGSLRQVNRTTDYWGIPITVYYAYPADYYDTDLAGETIYQTGTVSLGIPAFTMTGKGLVATNTPLVWANKISGRLNSDRWFGGAARCWICQPPKMKLYDASTSPNLYETTVIMEYHNEGWEEWAYFRLNDGTVPPPPCPGAIKHVVQYPTADFNVPFPTSQ